MKKVDDIIFKNKQKRVMKNISKKEEKRMTLIELNNIIDQKIYDDEEKIVITFFEMIVKENLSMEDLGGVEHLIMQRLKNLGYTVYKTGESYAYKGNVLEVQTSELLVAIKRK